MIIYVSSLWLLSSSTMTLDENEISLAFAAMCIAGELRAESCPLSAQLSRNSAFHRWFTSKTIFSWISFRKYASPTDEWRAALA